MVMYMAGQFLQNTGRWGKKWNLNVNTGIYVLTQRLSFFIYSTWYISVDFYLGSEVVCGQDVFVLGSRCAPGVVQLEALVTEVGPAVSAAFAGLQSLRRFAELTHDCHAPETHGVPVPAHVDKERHQSSSVHSKSITSG